MDEAASICDIIEPLKGWRWFLFNGKAISSLNGWTWLSNTCKAECYARGASPALYHRGPYVHLDGVPAAGCTCGVYSMKTPMYQGVPMLGRISRFPQEARFGSGVTAEVESWGNVIRHQDGYRSEYCKILRLFVSTEALYKIGQLHHEENIRLNLIAKSLNIDIFVYDRVVYKLNSFGREWEIKPECIKPDGITVVVYKPVMGSPFPFALDGQAIASIETTVERKLVPFHSVEFQQTRKYREDSGTVIVNYATEDYHEPWTGDRRSEGRGENLYLGREEHERMRR